MEEWDEMLDWVGVKEVQEFKCSSGLFSHSFLTCSLDSRLKTIIKKMINTRLPQWLSVKESVCNSGDTGDADSIPWPGRSLEKEMATHSSYFAWRIPWTEEPGGLQPMRLQRVGHDWKTEHAHTVATQKVKALSEGFSDKIGAEEFVASSVKEGIKASWCHIWTALEVLDDTLVVRASLEFRFLPRDLAQGDPRQSDRWCLALQNGH